MRVYYLKSRDIVKALIMIVFAMTIMLLINWNSRVITTINEYRAIFEGNKDSKTVALTFNVDWGEEYIPSILEILKKENATATFFISGRWAKSFPEHVKAIAAAGHEIGNHGYYHKHHERIGFKACLKEIKDTEMIIYDICNIRTKLFAPPYGEKGESVIESAYRAGYRTVYWTLDTIDWRRPAPEKIINRVKKKGLSNGTIILMHPTEPTVKALPEIINYVKANEYTTQQVSKIAGGY